VDVGERPAQSAQARAGRGDLARAGAAGIAQELVVARREEVDGAERRALARRAEIHPGWRKLRQGWRSAAKEQGGDDDGERAHAAMLRNVARRASPAEVA
jgi:hypothetical protein